MTWQLNSNIELNKIVLEFTCLLCGRCLIGFFLEQFQFHRKVEQEVQHVPMHPHSRTAATASASPPWSVRAVNSADTPLPKSVIRSGPLWLLGILWVGQTSNSLCAPLSITLIKRPFVSYPCLPFPPSPTAAHLSLSA